MTLEYISTPYLENVTISTDSRKHSHHRIVVGPKFKFWVLKYPCLFPSVLNSFAAFHRQRRQEANGVRTRKRSQIYNSESS